MSALADRSWPTQPAANRAAARRPQPPEKMTFRRRIDAIRDTLIVLGIQIVFRAMLALRRWNY
ncbi:MAG TPA: hypothetical protein VEG64_12610 [Candidatus Sulfotelmatobacter sp.]|nr:hypothetical protein [Candidatus Sulfotelmatobacter sp.]